MSLTRRLFALALIAFSALLLAEPVKEERQCTCVTDVYGEVDKHAQALRNYAEAFKQSFDGHYEEAAAASDRAALYDHNTTAWPLDAKQFSEHHMH